MIKREWKKLVLILIVILALGFVSLRVIKFSQEKENITIESEPEETTEKFENTSDMSEEEIRNLVEEKREQLKEFFLNIQYYKPSEVAQNYTIEDDENLIVIDSKFWEDFQKLVTEEIIEQFKGSFELVEKQKDINIEEELYIGSKNTFEDILIESAITVVDVTEEQLVPVSATDTEIITYENIRYYNEEGICIRDDAYSFNLIKENEEWKISEFISKRQ